MVTSSEDGWVKVWQTKDGSIQRSYDHGVPVNDVVIHPNQGEVIACDRGGSVRIWDLGENKCTQQLIPEDDISVSSVSVATDGSLLCAGTNSVSEAATQTAPFVSEFNGLTFDPGHGFRLADDPNPRHHHPRTLDLFPSSHRLRNTRPPLPRCPPSRHLQRRPQRSDLDGRYRRRSQATDASTTATSHARLSGTRAAASTASQ